MAERLLLVESAGKIFSGRGERVAAVKSMSLEFPADQAKLITLAGESGCGKSTLALMVLGFLRPSSGRILYRGKDVFRCGRGDFRRFRREVQAVFQNPFEVFNPF